MYQCAKCVRSFTRPLSLATHFQCEHVLGKFICSVEGCNFIGNFPNEVFVHFTSHHTVKNGTLKDGLIIQPEAYKSFSAVPSEEPEWRAKENDTNWYQVSLNRSKHKYLIHTLMCPYKECEFMCIYKDDFSEFENHCMNFHQTKWYLCLAPNCNKSFDAR